MQEAMRLHALTRPGVELQQVILQSDERLDWDRLVAAWVWVLERHPGLRAVFDTSDPSCTRLRVATLPPNDMAARASIEGRPELEALLQRDRDIARTADVPFGGLTLLNAPVCDFLVWTHHHAHVDGRSIEIVMSDLLRRYDDGPTYNPTQAGDLAEVLRARAALNTSAAVDFFAERLRGFDEATPTPGAAAGEGLGATAESHASLDAKTVAALRALGDEHGFTPANAVQLAWGLILSRYTHRDDVVFGVTRSGRYLVDNAKGVVGCLINTIPVRVKLKPDIDRLSALRGLREDALAARPHEGVPLAEVRTRLGFEAGLLDTVIVHEGNTLQGKMQQLLGKACGGRTFSLRCRSAPALILAIYEDEDGSLVVKAEYRQGKVAKFVADSLPGRVTTLLREFVRHPRDSLSSICVAEPHERAPLRSRVPTGLLPTSLADRLRTIVRTRPQATTMVELSTGLRMNYAQLEAAVSAFSRRLLSLGVSPGDVVAVSARPSAETVVAFWGCVYTGAVYLPIDPTYPSDRRDHMLADSGARVVALSSKDDEWAGDCFAYARIPTEGDGDALVEPAKVDNEDPLYLIYTSGSSGAPKGVVVPTRALLHHAAAACTKYGLAQYDSVFQFASPSFDVWLEEVVPTILVGASLVLRDEACARSVHHLLERVREHRVSVLQLPTAFFNEVVAAMTRSGVRLPPTVRLVIIGGERANAVVCARFTAAHSEVRLVNAYGPTEATITSVAFAMHGEKRAPGEVPIGRPLGNTLAWVVDSCDQPAPPGGVGELILGGPQLALGYHGRAEQTAAAFPVNLFGEASTEASRTYRTGDLVATDQAGELVYVGRVDQQVKVRGYRIELGEVESVLRSLAGVAEGVVVFHHPSTNDPRLVAWVVPANGSDEVTIKAELGTRLPHYMVPADVCLVSRLPTAPGGKVDRRELSQRVPPQDPAGNEVAAAPLATKLAELFGAVVARPVGPDDDFFDVGGHSLRVIRLVSDIRETLGLEVGAGAVFAARTPRRLAQRLKAEGSGASDVEFVELNAGHAGVDPMYCILGIDVYRPIAERLGPRPVIGVYVPEEDRTQDAMVSTEDLAKAYRETISKRGNGRARSVCGVSYGGIVALELARQLASEGTPLDLLVLLDPILPEMEVDGRWDGIHRLVHRLRYQPDELPKRLLRRLGLDPDRPTAEGPNTEADRAAWLERRRRYSAALTDYVERLRPYSQRTVVFVARDRRPGALSSTVRRWQELLGPFARIEVVPGTHGSFIKPPHVEGLVERLAHLLDLSMRDTAGAFGKTE